jgi:hypothetical protein
MGRKGDNTRLHAGQLGHGACDISFADRADLALRLGEDDIGAELLKERNVDRINA